MQNLYSERPLKSFLNEMSADIFNIEFITVSGMLRFIRRTSDRKLTVTELQWEKQLPRTSYSPGVGAQDNSTLAEVAPW